MRTRFFILTIAGALVTFACASATPVATRAPSPSALSQSANDPATTPGSFAFGVEYMLPGLAATYAQTGATSTRPAGETFSWHDIEPNAPRALGQHDYQWSKVDRYVSEYQAAGFSQIQIYTTAWNSWASSKPKNYFPDPQYMSDYEDYIFNLVERYDGDGKGDMTGLKYPVLDFVIEREWTEFFPGTTDEYLELLTVAHRAVKRANPYARVGLVPLMMIDVFDNNPTTDQIAQRVKINRSFRHPISETEKLLTHPELFDVVEIHSLGDYTELDATANWLRTQMKKNGYEKPIFAGDALGISQMIWPQNPRALTSNATDADFLTFAPIRADDALRVVNLLEAMKNKNAAEHDAATPWFRTEHTKSLVKKLVTAIGAGYAGMNVWSTADIAALQQPRVTGDWFFMGMIDARLGLGAWTPGAPRPAYDALEQTIEKLKDYSSVKKLGTGSSVVAYRFTVRDKSVLVVWNEPGRIYFPGESEPTVKANLPVQTKRATVTQTITEIGATAPRVETVNAPNGILALTLDSTPVFIEPQ